MANYDLEKAKAYFAAKTAFTTGPHELNGADKNDVVIVDVRFPSDWRSAYSGRDQFTERQVERA